jgi:hypothetical protein
VSEPSYTEARLARPREWPLLAESLRPMGVRMPTFITIGYGDRAGYDRTPEPLRAAAHANDAALVSRGALMGTAGGCVQVRNPEDAGVVRTAGPFMRSDLPLAGFAVIEAASLDEAVRLISRSPCAVAHGVIEVWPVLDAGSRRDG